MKVLAYIFILFVFASCSSKVIYYEYNGTVLSRIDKDGEVRLYYGDIQDSKPSHPYVKVTFHGFNSGSDAYVFFKEDKSVEVVGLMGYFTESGSANNLITLKRYGNPVFDSVRSVYEQKGLALRIMDGVNIEKERNREIGSKVKATYP